MLDSLEGQGPEVDHPGGTDDVKLRLPRTVANEAQALELIVHVGQCKAEGDPHAEHNLGLAIEAGRRLLAWDVTHIEADPETPGRIRFA
jgi:hypothetical protein